VNETSEKRLVVGCDKRRDTAIAQVDAEQVRVLACRNIAGGGLTVESRVDTALVASPIEHGAAWHAGLTRNLAVVQSRCDKLSHEIDLLA
jgi:hypothetical protein